MRVRCEYLKAGGTGVCLIDGKTAYVPSLLPGEEAEIISSREKKNHIEVLEAHRLEDSPLRIKPSCPYSGSCGGCDFDYVSEESSAFLKKDIVINTVRRSTGEDISSVMLPPVWGRKEGYRARCRIHVSLRDRKLGFLSKKSNSLVEVSSCPLLTVRLNEILSNPSLVFTRAQSYLFSKGVNPKTGFIELSLFDADDRVLIEKDEGIRTIGPYVFNLSANVFFQSNPHLLPELFRFVRENAEGHVIMDLYSGVGTFSTLFENEGKDVTAVERDRYCLSLARRNAPSAAFYTDDVSSWARKVRKSVDTVIVDPPRTGLGKDTSELIASWNAERIIYVSCNSVTLASDLRELTRRYRIVKAQVFDFYPSSSHEESAVLLERK